ncbi:TerB family tellurite resistance protein [bacterium CPR1]|nr:TerB family tellurite resistance protein [bacterium CPR1]
MDSNLKQKALALIQMAWADKFWAPEEEKLVTSLLLKAGCQPEDLEDLAARPPHSDLTEIERILPDHESRLQGMRTMIAVAFCDGVLAGAEMDLIDKLAARLGITPAELETLRTEALEMLKS